MPAKRMSFDSVRQLVRDLLDVEDGTAYGSPAFKVRGRMFACLPTHRSAESARSSSGSTSPNGTR